MNKIVKGDIVKMMLGKDNGRTGSVVRVMVKEAKIVVEGMNVYKRAMKKMGQTEGQIIEITKPVKISNVMVICPNCEKPTRVGFQIDGTTKNRVCRKCGKVFGGVTKTVAKKEKK